MSEQTKYILCPYCGHTQAHAERCAECGGLFEPLSRRATQIAMGPWYIRDKQSPFRPGCCYDVLKKQIRSGRIKPHTVLRGPTTRQFWSVARHVPGVAHLLGYCHACGAKVSPDDGECGECGVTFQAVRERNELGLAYRTNKEAQRAQQLLDMEITGRPPTPGAAAAARDAANDDISDDDDFVVSPTIGQDLLAEVLGGAPATGSRRSEPPPEPPAPRAEAEALDFTPSDEPPPRPTPRPRQRISLVTLLIVILNLLVLVGVVFVTIKVFRDTSAITDRSRELMPERGEDDDAPAADDVQRDMPTPPRQNGTPPRDDSAGPAGGLPDDVGGRSPAADEPRVTPAIESALQDAIVRERDGDLAGALAIIQPLMDKTPAAERPVELDILHRRLKDKLAREESSLF